jgi:hypothetical protein
MMIKTFKNNFEYIDFITSVQLTDNEVMCSNFIPSSFFPKDIIDYFFDKKESIPEHKLASEKLWNYGKQQQLKLKESKIKFAFEFDSFNKFLEFGLVHEASKNFETSLSTRIAVVEKMISVIDNIFLITEPTPFVFRLIPTETVIIDVDRNKTSQTIQGIVIQDKNLYDNFYDEFNRLTDLSEKLIPKTKLLDELVKAKQTLKNGTKTRLKI